MSYISRRLAPDEQIVSVGRFHFIQKAWPWIALLVLGIIGIGVIIFVVEMSRMATTRMAVTNRRVILKRGFFVSDMNEITLGSIEGAEIRQSIFGRMFGFGKLVIRGRGETHLVFPTMDSPGRFRAAIEDARMHNEVKTVHLDTEPPVNETTRERKLRLKREAKGERRAH
jgi:hypothetical protein